MRRKLFNPISLTCCFFLLLAVFADLNGKWTGVIKTPDGNELQVVYNFKVAGDTLKGDSFSFKVTVEGIDYPHTGKVYDDSCALDIDFGNQIVHTTLKRATDVK